MHLQPSFDYINPSNRNQRLNYASIYRNLPVMQEKGPMIESYLESLYRVIDNTLADYPRVCAFRFDLRFPWRMHAEDDLIDNQVISRFIESLKAKIKHNRMLARQSNTTFHDTKLRYVWAREVGDDNRVHYHVALLCNRDAYFSMGNFISGLPNMYQRIHEAWASALGLPQGDAIGSVHVPPNAVYRFSRDDTSGASDFFFRASYLCKVSTKNFGLGHHGFGASRQ